jgi:hypothetical protein
MWVLVSNLLSLAHTLLDSLRRRSEHAVIGQSQTESDTPAAGDGADQGEATRVQRFESSPLFLTGPYIRLFSSSP